MDSLSKRALESMSPRETGARECDAGLLRFKCVCAYDGTDFCGWQSQSGGGGVQDFIEKRLCEIFKMKVRIHGSGRTDAGVHADNQVFHFDAPWRHGSQTLLAALRSGFPKTIQIKKVSVAGKDFHARFSASGKRYVYRIYEGYVPPKLLRFRWGLDKRVVDVGKMIEAAEIFIGTHDFTAFSANRRSGKKEDALKTVNSIKISKRGREIKISVEGDGFLYKMVRMIVGGLVDVGLGRLSRGDLKAALDSRKRGTLIQAAPASGLTLERVFYRL